VVYCNSSKINQQDWYNFLYNNIKDLSNMNKYIGDHTLTTKALGKDDADEVAMDLHNVNSINLDFAILEYLKDWKYFPVNVRLRAMPGKENQRLRIRTFQLSRHLFNREKNHVFNQLIIASPFEMWSRVVVRAQNNDGYHLHNSYVRDQQLYPSETSHDRLSPKALIEQDVRAFSQYNMLWMDTMEQYKQDVEDNNWFCLDVPDKTWFITIYQK
jgi:hypothetical protein